MSQFDMLIIFPLSWSLTFTLLCYYTISRQFLIPNFFGTKKFRKKKLNLHGFYRVFNDNSETKASASAITAF